MTDNPTIGKAGGDPVVDASVDHQGPERLPGTMALISDASTTSGNRVSQPTYDRTVGFACTTTAHWCARMLQDHASNLTVTRPTAKEPSRLYAVLPTGILADDQHVLQAMLSVTHDIYGCEIIKSDVKGAELAALAKHCRSLMEPRALPSILKILGGVLVDLQRRGMLPEDLDVCDSGDIDADWHYLGAPNGVIDLRTRKLLPPEIARWRRITAIVADDYNPDAEHPLVDLVMPLDPDSEERAWWHTYRGWALSHPVHRDLVAMGTPPNAGKTVIRNADVRSMGDYVVTVGRSAWAPATGYGASSTAHNGELTRMRAPARIAYSSELAPPINCQVLNEVTGGDEGTRARDIREKAIVLHRPPHLVAQFNTGPGETPLLPIGGKTEAEKALRDRTICLPMPQIPVAKRDSRLMDVSRTDQEFRQAWVARTVLQCSTVLNGPYDRPTAPPGCTTMKEELDRQARAALPTWEKELLPQLFRPRGPRDSATVSAADSYTAYRAYMAFHEADGGGAFVSKTKFTMELKRHYGSNTVRGKIRRAADDPKDGLIDAWIWPHLVNNPEPAASSQYRSLRIESIKFEDSAKTAADESQISCEKCENGESLDPSRVHNTPPVFGSSDGEEPVRDRLGLSETNPASTPDSTIEDKPKQPELIDFGFSSRGDG